MERLPIELADPTSLGACTRHELGEALGTTAVAINFYRIEPGGGLPAGLHAHFDQEEVFIVLAGTAVFETFDGAVTLGAGEAIRFAPGEFQSGRNPGETAVELLALGAPKDTEDIRIPCSCPECTAPSLRLSFGDQLTFVCPECAASRVPADCPSCDSPALQIHAAGDGTDTETVCQDCGATYEEPPFED